MNFQKIKLAFFSFITFKEYAAFTILPNTNVVLKEEGKGDS